MTRKAIAPLCALAMGVSAGAVAAVTTPIAPPASGNSATASASAAYPGVILHVAADSVEILEGRPASDAGSARTSGRVIPDKPLSFAMVEGIAIVADVRVANLTLWRDVLVPNVSTVIRLGDRLLRIDPLTMTGPRGGSMEATFEVYVDAREQYRIASRIRITRMDGSAVLALLGAREVVSGAKTDASINLSGHGATIRALARALHGDVRIVVGPGRIATATVAFGGDALLQVLETVNPFRKTDKETRLQCAVLRFPISDGIAVIDRGLGVQTDKLNVIGAGAVNLRDETLDLAFHPQMREGLGINIKATLADMVRVRGTLANPTIGIDPEGSARTALHIGAAVLTAGTSLVVTSLFDRAVATQPCDAALGKVHPSSATPTKAITETLKAPARVLDGILRK